MTVKTGTRAEVDGLKDDFDRIVVATGVHPRKLTLPGIDHEKVLSYVDVLRHDAPVGRKVVLIGAGGIGFDVAEFLSHDAHGDDAIDAYLNEWGVDREISTPGGLKSAADPPPPREITLCQRKKGKLGARLGKTTGWIHRTSLKKRGVEMLAECAYERIDDEGLHLTVAGESRVIDADNIIICAGQNSANALVAPLKAAGVEVDVIGGAHVAAELDARRAIDQATRLAAAV